MIQAFRTSSKSRQSLSLYANNNKFRSTMNSLVIVLVASLASLALAMPYDIAEDADGQAYYLVPVHRQRRQAATNIDISRSGAASISHQGNIYRNDHFDVNGGAFASKPLHPNGPLTFGGKVGIAHDSGSNLNLGASHTESRGTNFNAAGTYNLARSNDGNTRLDAVGTYSRHYGGLSGTQHPNYYGGLQFTHNF